MDGLWLIVLVLPYSWTAINTRTAREIPQRERLNQVRILERFSCEIPGKVHRFY